ncbi:MAG TPA: 30S ribosome-binding factor RbfA [Ktedonobacterales bacterium]|nr:30S ribosome-binding factor RbfA [Ktedonobacterales bacterium]
MRNYRREDQLSGAITRELSDLMRTRMKDPRIGFASITGVELSHDLRYAKVYVSVMGSPEEQRETMRGLDSANGFLRRELAQRLTIRHVPEISFRLDESIARGARVLDLLKQVEQESDVPVSAESEREESD